MELNAASRLAGAPLVWGTIRFLASGTEFTWDGKPKAKVRQELETMKDQFKGLRYGRDWDFGPDESLAEGTIVADKTYVGKTALSDFLVSLDLI